MPREATIWDTIGDFLKIFALFCVVRIVMLDSGMRFINIPIIDHYLRVVLRFLRGLAE